ncbi:MAG: energy-coupling factor transporter transmembrane component T [Chloroflexota bacterium]|nr:energy-coupling factor transporter transmembrane component T [Chloroflexota bacterium]
MSIIMLFDLYTHPEGWLHRLDPRTKIAILLFGSVLFVVINNVWLLAGLLVIVQLMLLSSHVPFHDIVRAWRQLLRLIVVVVLLWPFFARTGDPALFSIGPLTATRTGILMGVTTAMRIVGTSFLFYLILFTTRQNDLVAGLRRLGLPFEWALTLATALRFIPSFSATITQIQAAQAARGWQVDRGDLIGRFRGMIPVLTALIISILRTSDTLGMALAARGVGSGRPRTVWQDVKMQPLDWIVLVTIGFFFVSLLIARLRFGMGAELVDVF